MLNELCVRWVNSRSKFCFGEKFVEFKEIDVCLGLGLNLLRDKIYLNELVGFSNSKKYFGSGKNDGNGFIQWNFFVIFQVVDDVGVSIEEFSHAIVKATVGPSGENFNDHTC